MIQQPSMEGASCDSWEYIYKLLLSLEGREGIVQVVFLSNIGNCAASQNRNQTLLLIKPSNRQRGHFAD